jgi:hypothetical protein
MIKKEEKDLIIQERQIMRKPPLRRKPSIFLLLFIAFCFLFQTLNLSAKETKTKEESIKCFIERINSLISLFNGEASTFCLEIKAQFKSPTAVLEPRVNSSSEVNHQASLTIFRNDIQEWGMVLQSSWRHAGIYRTATYTSLILPDSGIRFIGYGKVANQKDSLDTIDFAHRFITPETSAYGFFSVLRSKSFSPALKFLLLPYLKAIPPDTETSDEYLYQAGKNLRITVSKEDPLKLKIFTSESFQKKNFFSFFEITCETGKNGKIPVGWFTSSTVSKEVSRDDLEKMIFRGLKRILSVKMPAEYGLVKPQKIENGELVRHEGQTLVLLSGNPEQIGTAHGLLLAPWNRLLVDSTIYLIGLVETISKGKWFLDQLEEAWARLSPYIPSEQHREMAAIASACPEISLREVRLSNIFPEYFHCSGFALFGRATKDGLLYHGRILDYMTEIGLQKCAVNFIIVPDKKWAFFSPGFAGIVGSVGGMNEKKLSIGEMGGRGRYDWDGVPMATLVRQALEECESIRQLKSLWQNNPRTCEYFYVFADGKVPDALGVWATSAKLEFLQPGESHFFLGPGIDDVIVMSAGNRLKRLRERVTGGYGTFTATSSLRLMDRPVSMQSNLHNSLYIPKLGLAYVAIAGDFEPAAQQKYVKYNLDELLLNFKKNGQAREKK